MHKKFTEQQIKKLNELCSNGMPISTISINYNVSKSSLYKWFAQYKIERSFDSKVYNGRDIFFLNQEVEQLREEKVIVSLGKYIFC